MTHGDAMLHPVGGGNSGGSNGNGRSQTGGISEKSGGNPAGGGELSANDDSAANTPMSAKLGKMISIRVLMLDDSITLFQVQVI